MRAYGTEKEADSRKKKRKRKQGSREGERMGRNRCQLWGRRLVSDRLGKERYPSSSRSEGNDSGSCKEKENSVAPLPVCCLQLKATSWSPRQAFPWPSDSDSEAGSALGGTEPIKGLSFSLHLLRSSVGGAGSRGAGGGGKGREAAAPCLGD